VRSGAYPFPADEFDAAARAGGPRGVHRATRTRWSRWWPFLVVLLLFPALAYAGVTWLSDWQGLGGNDQSDTGAAPSAQPTGTTGDTTETAAPEATVEPTVEPPPAPPVDQARTVLVSNATTTSGLADNGRTRLEAAGFTSVTADNWDAADPAASVVYYQLPADITTAQLVASTLGIATVQESAELAPDGIVAVLAGDYTAV